MQQGEQLITAARMSGNFPRGVVPCPPNSHGGAPLIFGLSTETYTLIHVAISLIGIGSGLIILFGLLTDRRLDSLTVLFLATTMLTSLTGFGFPFDHLLPSHKVGMISLVVLAIALVARYAFHLAGKWRWIYVVTAVM